MSIGPNVAVSRFRSFAERYVIERASSFRSKCETEDAWLAVEDAKKIYGIIADAIDPDDSRLASQQHAPQQHVTGLGATGPMVWRPPSQQSPSPSPYYPRTAAVQGPNGVVSIPEKYNILAKNITRAKDAGMVVPPDWYKALAQGLKMSISRVRQIFGEKS